MENQDDMEKSMSSLILPGETMTPEDEATEKGRMWNSMSAIDDVVADLTRPSQFLPLRPTGKSKMNQKPSAPSPRVRAHNRPDGWFGAGQQNNTKRSWRPKIVLEDGQDTCSEIPDDSGHGSFAGHNSIQSLPTFLSCGQPKGYNVQVPTVIQRKTWVTPTTTEKPKLSLDSSSFSMDNAPDLDDTIDKTTGLKKTGLLDMAMAKMEASMTSVTAVEDDLTTISTGTTRSGINMWNSMSVINTPTSLDADAAQSRASKGSRVKWSLKDLEAKKNNKTPTTQTINEKTADAEEDAPELETSLTSLASNASSNESSTDNDAATRIYSKSMSCIESDKPDEFKPLRTQYRAQKASDIQHKFVAHNRPGEWLGKKPKKSWTVKKVVEVGDMGDGDNSGDESD
jgi:hypothetical protein